MKTILTNLLLLFSIAVYSQTADTIKHKLYFKYDFSQKYNFNGIKYHKYWINVDNKPPIEIYLTNYDEPYDCANMSYPMIYQYYLFNDNEGYILFDNFCLYYFTYQRTWTYNLVCMHDFKTDDVIKKTIQYYKDELIRTKADSGIMIGTPEDICRDKILTRMAVDKMYLANGNRFSEYFIKMSFKDYFHGRIKFRFNTPFLPHYKDSFESWGLFETNSGCIEFNIIKVPCDYFLNKKDDAME